MTNQQTNKNDAVPNYLVGRTGRKHFKDTLNFGIEEAIVMDTPVKELPQGGKAVVPMRFMDGGVKKLYIDVGLIFPTWGPKTIEFCFWGHPTTNKFKVKPIELADP